MKSFTGTVADPFADPVVPPGGFSPAFRRISTLNSRAGGRLRVPLLSGVGIS
ncbi:MULTISPECIES: hypothetical protein [Dickeya]|uniref:hypothetical protein n=1 Tax=Dickeya TaxID=204037 RepID=UPI00030246A6|nr:MULTISPECIES: hypothetical protein [Dickeya]